MGPSVVRVGWKDSLKGNRRFTTTRRDRKWPNVRSKAPQSHAWKPISDIIACTSTQLITNLQLCHEHLEHSQEFSCAFVGWWLLVKAVLECPKKVVETSGLDHGPGNDRELPAVQLGDEIIASLVTDYSLKLQRKPGVDRMSWLCTRTRKIKPTRSRFPWCQSQRRPIGLGQS